MTFSDLMFLWKRTNWKDKEELGVLWDEVIEFLEGEPTEEEKKFFDWSRMETLMMSVGTREKDWRQQRRQAYLERQAENKT